MIQHVYIISYVCVNTWFRGCFWSNSMHVLRHFSVPILWMLWFNSSRFTWWSFLLGSVVQDGWVYRLWCVLSFSRFNNFHHDFVGHFLSSYYDMEGELDSQPHLHGSSSTRVPFTGVLCCPRVCSRSVIKDVAPEGKGPFCRMLAPDSASKEGAKTLETRFLNIWQNTDWCGPKHNAAKRNAARKLCTSAPSPGCWLFAKIAKMASQTRVCTGEKRLLNQV